MTSATSGRVLTLPNVISAIRLLLIAPIGWLIVVRTHPVATVVLVVVFGLSDWADGRIARRLGQESRLGKALDPVADRLGVAVLVVTLTVAGDLPWGVPAAIVATDLVVGGVTTVRRARWDELFVSWVGKIRTACIMLGLAAMVVGRIPGFGWSLEAGRVLVILGAVLHVVAGVGYLRQLLAPRPPRPARGLPQGRGAAGEPTASRRRGGGSAR